MINTLRAPFLILALSLLVACVTINIYFPAAQAEAVAEKIIDSVLGDDANGKKESNTDDKGASLHFPLSYELAEHLLNFIIPTANAAEPPLTADTPEVHRLEAKMAKRHKTLSNYYHAKAIGFTGNGLVKVFNASAVPLKERNKLKKLVAAENADRKALYRAIATASNHPEWQADIQSTFAKQWIGRANSNGWLHD